MKVVVLRLGHRKERDKRITTHCALVARAFGANEFMLSGEFDPAVLQSVKSVVANWGGNFKAKRAEDFALEIKNAKRRKTLVVHLTFYGEKFQTAVKKIKILKPKTLMLVIGAKKVPSEVYELADLNVSIGNQPHSEVAALALFLYELNGKKQLYLERKKWKLKITPSKKDKLVKFRGGACKKSR